MKKTLFLAIIIAISKFAGAQFITDFESSTIGYTLNNMNVSGNNTICGSKSAHSAGAFNESSTNSIITPTSTLSGSIMINFAYYVSSNTSTNWSMVVQLYKVGVTSSVYSNTYNSNGGMQNPGCSTNFEVTTPSMPSGSYYAMITFTSVSTNNDAAHNYVVVDNFSFGSINSLPVTFVGFPAVQRVDDQYVKVIFSVAEQSNISVYNIQFSEDQGRTWKTMAVVMPDNAVPGKTYTVNVKFPKTK